MSCWRIESSQKKSDLSGLSDPSDLSDLSDSYPMCPFRHFNQIVALSGAKNLLSLRVILAWVCRSWPTAARSVTQTKEIVGAPAARR